MKTIIKYLLPILLLSGWLTSCNNAEEFKDVVYFTGTDVSPVVKYSLEEPTPIGLSVRSSAKVSGDVKVGIKVNESLVDQYNEVNGTNYILLPKNAYSFDISSVTIESGKYATEPFYLNITSIDDFRDEDTFCLPIEITDVKEGDMPILESSKVMYVVINKTIITKAATLNGTYFRVNFESDPSRDLSAVPQVTMEARINLFDYQNGSPYISTVMGLEEHFLIRLGDVTIPKDIIQLAGGGYPVSSTRNIGLNEWVHVAVTYDGARICLYLDGSLNAYVDAPRGPINLLGISPDRTFFIGTTSNSTGRTLKGYISEARLWTRALTEAEIANNICAVSADAPDLLAYWKFNSWKDDATKNIVVDYTGHGYDAVGNRNITWVEGVRCP
ncbi:hypothetical protein M2451_004120 [Dysgonomonas sp. PFB1-18]|uniref:DUF1735 and LamG domain-containing protein n=1 Tax=unclassified Dysgonomonas TaxID=2630389 RepID=UPI0024753F70|nr:MULTISPECIES: DUF1735 and LamG domain-containing protein [unclassified Dysgonomonas]MDH6311189.1 hypothetical protein [Dysgonomonas sp. PF1-14]MDH6341077.1 hypothetical protein [Dysgonomonas sp. PF1-16]MDH6382770.1 hypothetical protein [Dysgonomonas sp. PFB1-18]MDH6400061.1 hypothetical protein [Dysgonomonas sp. PF1-23]